MPRPVLPARPVLLARPVLPARRASAPASARAAARAAIVALGLALGLPVAAPAPAAAQARLSDHGLTATLDAPGRITVGWRPGTPERQYWCAAAALATAQGVHQTTRLARLDPPARRTDVRFSTDPADVAAGGGDSLGRAATGLFSFPGGNSLTVGFAASLCDLDHILHLDDD